MLIGALARTPGTLLHQALDNDDWTRDQHLLALLVDQSAIANWQRQGKSGAQRPKPISPLARPKPESRTGNTKGRTDGEVIALLEGYRTGRFDRG